MLFRQYLGYLSYANIASVLDGICMCAGTSVLDGICMCRDVCTGWDMHVCRDVCTGWNMHVCRDVCTGWDIHVCRDVCTGWDIHVRRDVCTGWDMHVQGRLYWMGYACAGTLVLDGVYMCAGTSVLDGICMCRDVCRQNKKMLQQFCSAVTCTAGSSVQFLLSLRHKIQQTAETINTASPVGRHTSQPPIQSAQANCQLYNCTLMCTDRLISNLFSKLSFYFHTFYVNFGHETK